MGNVHRRKRKERQRGRKLADKAWEGAGRSDLGEAEKLVRQALKGHEGDCVLWNDLGLVLWRKGELREAEAAFRNAILIRPHYEEGKMNLASLLGSRGFYRQALRIVTELAESASPRAEFHRKKAEEYRKEVAQLEEGGGGE